jgi:NhaA family Na+:H+ antiporter
LLPGIAAVGGMLVPALIYVVINYRHEISLQGWAIPTATDIAFSLGVLTVLGSRVPKSLKILLMALAIFDDLAAIIVIAVFYTSQISWVFLGLALLCVIFLVILNIKNIQRLSLYLLMGSLLWYCLTKAGIHSTLAGGILAFLIPAFSAQRLKYLLHPWVVFGILPLFAFANAGVSFMHISVADVEVPIVLGVFFGLFLGKQIGIFGLSWLAVKCRLCHLPEKLTWYHVYAMSVLCGIGFTMSLFIGTLAFGDYSGHLDSVKISVLLASVLSAVLGGGLLALNKRMH